VLQPGDVLTVPRRALIKVYAQGEVHTPGRQVLPAGSTVLDLLNATAGAGSSAKLSRAVILRTMEGKPTAIPVDLGKLMSRADSSQNLTLQDGDVLCIPARGDAGQGVWRWLPFLPYLLSL
jgi:protein involved in polysaccharide export with SLBB domain